MHRSAEPVSMMTRKFWAGVLHSPSVLSAVDSGKACSPYRNLARIRSIGPNIRQTASRQLLPPLEHSNDRFTHETSPVDRFIPLLRMSLSRSSSSRFTKAWPSSPRCLAYFRLIPRPIDFNHSCLTSRSG